jgi:hypothetical protein
MVDQGAEKFTIKEVGDRTGETYEGVFTTKTRLSYKDLFEQDRIRRQLVGPEGGPRDLRVEHASTILSALAVRLIAPFPAWWEKSEADGVLGNGFYDDNVLGAIYDKVMAFDKDVQAALAKKAAAAQIDLKAQQDAPASP